MLDREQQLIEAAMRYLGLLEQNQIVSIDEFVLTVDPALRAELKPYLEAMLALGEPAQSLQVSADELAVAERVAERVRARHLHQRATAQPHSLTTLRQARRLSIAALARQIDLPPDLLQRIERGGVLPATLPQRLIARLAQALQRAEDEIWAAFSAPHAAVSGTRLSAEDGTVVEREAAVSFAEALAQSTASAEQRSAWEQ